MRKGLIEKTYEWDLSADPATLWPLLSDSARLNEALNLQPYRISETFDGESIRRRYGELIEDGQHCRWEEPLYEWAENGWWRWRRFYDEGPFRETGAVLMLIPRNRGGTHMHYTLTVDPAGAMGKMLVASGHLKQAATKLQKLSREVDAYSRRPMGDFYSNHLARTAKKLDQPLPKAQGQDAELLMQFARWLAIAPYADRVDLRSKRLARCLGVSHAEALRACLTAVRSNDLEMRYRAECPACRNSALEFNNLGEVPPLLACRGCGVSFHRDLTRSIELLFAVSGARDSEHRYCASGPNSAQHIAVQQNLGAVERRDLVHQFPGGVYRVRAVDGPVSEEFELENPTGAHVTVTAEGITVQPHDGDTIIENHCKRAYSVAIERSDWPSDVLPLSEALTEQAFHDLMPEQSLRDGDTASAGQGAILGVADVAQTLSRVDSAAVFEADAGYYGLAISNLEQAVGLAKSLRASHPEARFALDYGPLTIVTQAGRMRYIGTVPDTARSLSMGGHRGVIVTSPRMKDALAVQGIAPPTAVLG